MCYLQDESDLLEVKIKIKNKIKTKIKKYQVCYNLFI